MIYAAVWSKDWALANELTQHLPTYRTFYSRAHAAAQMIESEIFASDQQFIMGSRPTRTASIPPCV
jgi:hypothetical protein